MAGAALRRQLNGKLSKTLARRSEAILTSLEQGRMVADVPPELNMLYRVSMQPFFIALLRYAPEVEIAKLTVPTLILQGDTDI